MSRVHFTLEDMQTEMVSYARRAAVAKRRLSEWHDDEPSHAARTVVFERGKLRLYHYTPRVPAPDSTPILVVYALVNRPYMADLTPTCSLLGEMLARGLDIYLIDWGYPDEGDRTKSLADYITGDLGACVDWILAARSRSRLDLFGICQGGTFSVCFAALYPERIGRLMTTVTPIDFQTPGDLLSHLLREVDVDALVDAFGNIPGDLLNAMFLAQKPQQLMLSKYVDFVANAEDDAASALFLAMEKWIFDSPALAGAAFAEFAKNCYQRNALAGGTLMLGSQPVSLRNLTMPILNVFARDDHLVPPSASRALGPLAGSDDYTEVELPGGHIGIYVSAKTRALLVSTVADWLSARA